MHGRCLYVAGCDRAALPQGRRQGTCIAHATGSRRNGAVPLPAHPPVVISRARRPRWPRRRLAGTDTHRAAQRRRRGSRLCRRFRAVFRCRGRPCSVIPAPSHLAGVAIDPSHGARLASLHRGPALTTVSRGTTLGRARDSCRGTAGRQPSHHTVTCPTSGMLTPTAGADTCAACL